ncbi:YopX family protein [Lentilactobacillus kefiri]|uniref:YopX family protein n=1 Tax=Lentilactobacillus kefiri TaxID=33962 RepID=UPI0021C2AE40|nr:YopX family protein [Lentilactobacillus kefiri]MCP9369148.1 hypothetical protein [Lentilactobacillus kefiri]
MNREIKFRIWRTRDEYDKAFWMESWDSLMNYSMSDIFQLDNPNDVLEQYTGLKDANGDDIYENDLVSLDPDDPPYQVIFDEGKFELSNDYLGLVYDLSEEHMDCVIVGNVHEDKELLEEEK